LVLVLFVKHVLVLVLVLVLYCRFDQANEWWAFDGTMGHLVSLQPSSGAGAGPFVATACS